MYRYRRFEDGAGGKATVVYWDEVTLFYFGFRHLLKNSDFREKLIWAAAQLFMRRRQMVQELRTIFFVEPVTPAVSCFVFWGPAGGGFGLSVSEA